MYMIEMCSKLVFQMSNPFASSSIPESETEAGDDVAIEEGIEGKHKTELWLNSLGLSRASA